MYVRISSSHTVSCHMFNCVSVSQSVCLSVCLLLTHKKMTCLVCLS